MSRRAGAAAAVAALALGAGCVLTGRAVLGERAGLARADAALAAPQPARRLSGGGIAAVLLSTGGDRAARAAAADYERARAERAPALAARQRARAESELARLAASGPGARRSWAATLVAVLEIDAVRGGGTAARRHLQESLDALRAAVAAEPGDEIAKRDLELLLTLQKHRPAKQKAHPTGRRKHARAGATAAPPGSGW